MAEACVKSTIGKLGMKQYLGVYPHSAAPSPNLHSLFPLFQSADDVIYGASTLFRPFQYDVSYPTPWLPPVPLPRPELNGFDPCLRFVDEKKQWEQTKKLILKNCKRTCANHKTLATTPDFNSESLHLPRNIVLLAKHLENDPDDQFTGGYNWYYGPTNMDCINIDDGKYLIRPDSTEVSALLLTELRLENGHWIPSLSDTYRVRTAERGPIYQIETLNGHFLSRQRHACLLFNTRISSDLSIKNVQTAKSKFPFVSCSLSPTDQNHFTTFTTNRELCIWSASSKKPLSCAVVPTEDAFRKTDNWGSVYYHDSNIILMADRYSFNIIDTRTSLDRVQYSWTIEKVTEMCEDICCTTSGSNNLQYVVTNHQMLGLDLKAGFVQRWTHMVPHSPCIVKVLKQPGLVDTVFIGGIHSDTVVAVENDWEGSDLSVGRVQPLALPSMTECLHAARYQGQCLTTVVAGRFNVSLTGICCIEDSDTNLVRCTSLGDIFIQRLVKRTKSQHWSRELSADQCNQLAEWEKKCKILLKKNKTKCTITSVKNVTHIIQGLSFDAEDTPENSTTFNMDLPGSMHSGVRPKWGISKSQLLKYRDYLAPKLLAIWNLDNEEEWDLNPEPEEEEFDVSSDEEDFVDKVKNWLDTYSAELDAEGNDQEQEDSIFQTTNDEIADDPDVEMDVLEVVEEPIKKPVKEPPNTPTLAIQSPAVARRKMSHVSGF